MRMTEVSNCFTWLRRFATIALGLLALHSPHTLAYEDRVALVIGNDLYPTEPLKNAVNDARAMQKTLQDLGFKVVFRPNADTVAMRSAAVEFSKILDGATAAVFYYAGHGIQHREKNYLIPIDAKFTSEAEIAFIAMEVNQIIEMMDDAKVKYKFVILDACRNNPFRSIFTQTGLAKMQRIPPGTVVSFAAQAGAVAFDGDANAENGIYTRHLLNEIKKPGLQATLVFQNTGSVVGEETARKQLPEFYSSPFPGGRPFYFAERSAIAASGPGTTGGPSADTALQAEREFWSSIKDSKRQDDFQAYLEQFPNGLYARLARNRIDEIKREKLQSQVAAAPLAGTPASAPPVLLPEKTAAPAPAPSPTPTGEAKSAAPPPSVVANVQAKATPAPVILAAAPAASSSGEGRGIEPKPAAFAPSQSAAQAPAAPPPVQLAALSPEQKSALPPAPATPKILTGTLEFPNGARYIGEYKEDKDKRQIMHGKGEFVSSAFRYTGEFRENRKDGRGLHIWASGDKYEGDFVEDEPAGKGTWEFSTGDKYEGEIAKGKLNGKGTLTTKAGDVFTGTFVDSLQHGKGVYRFANGDKYEGAMTMGKIAGAGVYVNSNGDRREATFVNGVAQGPGVHHFSNGDRYEGEFQAGAITGKGKYFFANGLRTEGNYVNGVLKGQGTFIFNNGTWFEGVWEEGGKARGVFISKDGTRQDAIIDNGRVEPLPAGAK
jgi:hypothetical protein